MENTFPSYIPSFRDLTTKNDIVKDNQMIVNNLLDYYERHFAQPVHNPNNPYYIECIEAYKRIENTPNIPLQKIEFDEIFKTYGKSFL